MTFFISGMECGTCTAMITQSVQDLKGVAQVDLEIVGGFGKITFDPRQSSAHQVAQAVCDAFPVHGRPFLATLKLRVPDYAKPGTAARVDAVFAKHRTWIEPETLDREHGLFLLHFEPLKAEEGKPGPQGWDPNQLLRDLRRPAPEGAGIEGVIVTDPYEPRPAKPGAAAVPK